VVAGPSVDVGLGKSSLGQHLQERPPPHGTGDSIGPIALLRHFLRRHVVVQKDVGHQEATAGPQQPERLAVSLS
jgi:hypothetical protein